MAARPAFGLDRYRNEQPDEIEEVAYRVIGCAIEVHRALGPGLIERLYEDALEYELREARLRVGRQVEVVIPYKEIELRGQKIDLVVEECVIVEFKAVEAIEPVHKAQLLSYLRASRLPLGLLINFNTKALRDGVRRVINEHSPAVKAHTP
ncbi:MAG: GxxExxY protein [Phycisphaerales bacterium]